MVGEDVWFQRMQGVVLLITAIGTAYNTIRGQRNQKTLETHSGKIDSNEAESHQAKEIAVDARTTADTLAEAVMATVTQVAAGSLESQIEAASGAALDPIVKAIKKGVAVEKRRMEKKYALDLAALAAQLDAEKQKVVERDLRISVLEGAKQRDAGIV